MDVIEVLKTRRSIRIFTQRTVAKEVISDIVECARFAPTARNEQPWEFVAVTDKEALKNIAGLTDYGKFIANAPCCVAVFCHDTKYFLEDGCAATMSMLLAAHAHGLGACWVAGDKKIYPEQIRILLGVPEGYRLVSLIPMGYSEARSPVPQKRALKEVLHWEHFGRHLEADK